MFEELGNSEFSNLVRTELWGWPLALTIHVFGTALLVGFILIVGLRLLGLFETIPYTSLNRLFPVVWLALLIQLASGFVLWMAKPTQYMADGAFMLKTALVAAGIFLTIAFQVMIKQKAPAWETQGATASRAVPFVAATIIVWCTVVIAGRLTGYLGSL